MLSKRTIDFLREMVGRRELVESNTNDNNPPILQDLRQAQQELADLAQGAWQRVPLPRESRYAREIDAHLATILMLYRKAGWHGEIALCRLTPTEAQPTPAGGVAMVGNEYQLQGGGPYDRYDFTLRRMRQIKGPDKWAVYRNGSPLSKEGEWEYEPIPSSRDDAYLKRCRYDSIEEALRHWQEWLQRQRPQPAQE